MSLRATDRWVLRPLRFRLIEPKEERAGRLGLVVDHLAERHEPELRLHQSVTNQILFRSSRPS